MADEPSRYDLFDEFTRRNISLPVKIDDWLRDDVDNASELIQDLLMPYRAYQDYQEAIEYIDEKRQLWRR